MRWRLSRRRGRRRHGRAPRPHSRRRVCEHRSLPRPPRAWAWVARRRARATSPRRARGSCRSAKSCCAIDACAWRARTSPVAVVSGRRTRATRSRDFPAIPGRPSGTRWSARSGSARRPTVARFQRRSTDSTTHSRPPTVSASPRPAGGCPSRFTRPPSKDAVAMWSCPASSRTCFATSRYRDLSRRRSCPVRSTSTSTDGSSSRGICRRWRRATRFGSAWASSRGSRSRATRASRSRARV